MELVGDRLLYDRIAGTGAGPDSGWAGAPSVGWAELFRWVKNSVLNFTSSWDLVIFRKYWIPNIGSAVDAQKGRTKKLKRHGLHGFALDQPSINGIGPINRSEKRSCFVAYVHERRCKGVQGETVGKSPRSHLRSAKKTCFYAIFKHVS